MIHVFKHAKGAIFALALAVLSAPFTGFAAAPLSSIAAVVNGEMITTFDLQSEMAPEMIRMGLDPRSAANAGKMDVLSRKVLDSMINNIILTQEAERLHVTASDSEVEEEVRRFMERSRLTPSEFQRQMQLQGITEKAFKSRIRNGILRRQLLSTMVGRKVVVTKEEIAEYYKQHMGMFKSNQNVRFSVLVYPPSADAGKFASRIKSGATSFESVAKEVSVGPKAQEGGDLGVMAWGDLDPAWRDRLSALKPGQTSDLFELNGLKAQVRLLELSSGEGQSLEEASEQIEAILREPKLQERFEEYTSQLRGRAMIDIRL